jgi:hypothetical protein
MNKVELFSIYQKHSRVDHSIWDGWFEWRLKNAGCKRHCNKDDPEYDNWHKVWLELLHTMPNHYDWYPTNDNMIVVSFGNDEEETFPLDLVVQDLDKEPELKMLWHSNYWDGPLSGMAKYNGEDVWFECCNEDDFGDRLFALYRLSEEDHKELFRQHELFQHHVGFHGDHDPNVYQEYKGGNDPDKYYKLQKKFLKTNKTDGEKLGEAHWFQFKYWSRPR